MVAIVDYGMGNLASVQKALNYLKVENKVTSDYSAIEDSDVILLPGVGSFQQGMFNLRERGLVEVLSKEVLINRKPFLGICLGMQLIMTVGTEPSRCDGLGWLEGDVKKIEATDLRIPHMGWNTLMVKDDTYLRSLNGKDFYFIHSYHVVPRETSYIVASVNYGFDITACIRKDNIFATQFHPEKSQQAGLDLLKQFFDSNVKS